MKIKLKPLLSALAYVGAAIKTKTTLPILSHVKLSVKDGQLTLSGSSLEVFITSVIECKGVIGDCCVKHAALLSSLSLAQGDDVELLLEKDERLTIKVGKSITKLHIMDPDELMPEPPEGKSIAVHPMALSNGLRSTYWAAADAKAGRPNMEFAIVDMTAKRLRCYAGNGYILASYREACICGDERLMIHADHCVTMANALLNKDAYLWSSPKHIGVTTPVGRVVVKKSEHPEPAFETVIKIIEKPADNAMLDLEPLKQICSRAKALSDNQAEISRIKIEIKDKLISASGKGNLGSFEDEIEWAGKFKATLILNAAYLMSALNHLKQDKISVHVTDSSSVWSSGDLTLAISQLRSL